MVICFTIFEVVILCFNITDTCNHCRFGNLSYIWALFFVARLTKDIMPYYYIITNAQTNTSTLSGENRG
jgi:hypothetical protein